MTAEAIAKALGSRKAGSDWTARRPAPSQPEARQFRLTTQREGAMTIMDIQRPINEMKLWLDELAAAYEIADPDQARKAILITTEKLQQRLAEHAAWAEPRDEDDEQEDDEGESWEDPRDEDDDVCLSEDKEGELKMTELWRRPAKRPQCRATTPAPRTAVRGTCEVCFKMSRRTSRKTGNSMRFLAIFWPSRL